MLNAECVRQRPGETAYPASDSCGLLIGQSGQVGHMPFGFNQHMPEVMLSFISYQPGMANLKRVIFSDRTTGALHLTARLAADKAIVHLHPFPFSSLAQPLTSTAAPTHPMPSVCASN